MRAKKIVSKKKDVSVPKMGLSLSAFYSKFISSDRKICSVSGVGRVVWPG